MSLTAALTGIIAPLLGGVGGAVLRTMPEVLRFMDKKGERKHELALQEYQLRYAKEVAVAKYELADLETNASQVTAAIEATKAAYENMKSGVAWVDALSATVRPMVTYILVGFWAFVKVAAYMILVSGGVDWATAATSLWSAEDNAMLSGVLTFWFLSRVFSKIKI